MNDIIMIGDSPGWKQIALAAWSEVEDESDFAEATCRAALKLDALEQQLRNSVPYYVALVWDAACERGDSIVSDFDMWLESAFPNKSATERSHLRLVPDIAAWAPRLGYSSFEDVLSSIGWQQLREVTAAWRTIRGSDEETMEEDLSALLNAAERLPRDALRVWLADAGYKRRQQPRDPAGPLFFNILHNGVTAITIIVRDDDVTRVQRALQRLASDVRTGDGWNDILNAAAQLA